MPETIPHPFETDGAQMAESAPAYQEGIETAGSDSAFAEHAVRGEEAALEGFVAKHPYMANAARILGIVTVLAAPKITTAGIQGVESDTDSTEPIVSESADRNATGFSGHIEQVLESLDQHKIAETIVALRACPTCVPDTTQRERYAHELFSTLLPLEVIRMSKHLDLIDDHDVRKEIILGAVADASVDEANYTLIGEFYEDFAPILSEDERTNLIAQTLSHYPVALAKTLGTRPDLEPTFTALRAEFLRKFDAGETYREPLQGTLHTLEAVYGEEGARLLVARAATHRVETLFDLEQELLREFQPESIRSLLTFHTSQQDPHTVLSIAHNLKHAEGYVHSAFDDGVVEQAIHHLLSFPYPQLTLRDAEAIHEALEDRPGLYDTVIHDAIDRCIEHPGGYHAIVEYHDSFDANIVDRSKTHDLYVEAATQAYTEGNFVDFNILYEALSKGAQRLLIAERAIAEHGETGDLSSEAREYYGNTYDLQRLVRPEDPPISTDDLYVYLARLAQDSLDATTLPPGHVRGKDITPVYPWTMFSAPVESLHSILTSPVFDETLRDLDIPYRMGNKISFAHGVYHALQQNGLDSNDATIHHAIREIVDTLNARKREVFMGPNTKVIAALHEDEVFDQQQFLSGLIQAAGVRNENMLVVAKGVRERGTEETNKARVLSAIEHANEGEIAIILEGHGSPENWALSNNTADALDRSLDASDSNISYKDLARALKASGNIHNMTIILSACYSYDYEKNLEEELAALGVTDRPRITITAAAKERQGWINTSGDPNYFVPSFLLQGLSVSMYDATERQGLTAETLLRAEVESVHNALATTTVPLMYTQDMTFSFGTPRSEKPKVEQTDTDTPPTPPKGGTIEIGMRGTTTVHPT